MILSVTCQHAPVSRPCFQSSVSIMRIWLWLVFTGCAITTRYKHAPAFGRYWSVLFNYCHGPCQTNCVVDASPRSSCCYYGPICCVYCFNSLIKQRGRSPLADLLISMSLCPAGPSWSTNPSATAVVDWTLARTSIYTRRPWTLAILDCE